MEWAPNPFEIREVPGNRALVILVDSIAEEDYHVFFLGILPALNHFGIPYRLFDIAGGESIPSLAGESAGVVLGQDGIGAALTRQQLEKLLDEINKGVGIASLDGRIWQADSSLYELFGLVDLQEKEIVTVTATNPQHYLTEMQQVGEVHELHQPINASIPGGLTLGTDSIAANVNKETLVVARDHPSNRQGRSVALLFSSQIWLREFFGHGMGLDDFLWRSLVWIATKPFPVLMIPPFATCRIDDASGANDHFGYLEILNEYSWITNVGLFVDEIDEPSAGAIKRYYTQEIAQFSAHSFHELGLTEPAMIYLRHDGREYTISQMAKHFLELDRFFDRVEINPSHTVNAHYDEIGLNALPFLAARKQLFTMNFIPAGVLWDSDTRSWEPYPYGNQGFNYGPLSPDLRFWNTASHYLGGYKTSDTHMMEGEFLQGNTPFQQENDLVDIEGAARKALRAIKVGISSGFFGTLMCHEQRIAAMSSDDLRRILGLIADGLSGWFVIYRSYDEIAQYTKDKARTWIKEARFDEEVDNLIVTLEGVCEVGISCFVFKDHDDHCIYDLVDTPPFTGTYAFPE
jgi:hypothetical protein